MCAATASAIAGSSRSHPVAATAATPTTTPAEVQTSVIRCFASASSAIERCWRPARASTRATVKLIAEAATDTARPAPTCSSGRGASSRSIAVHPISTAASAISAPSKALEKYSAFEYP